MVHFVSDMGDEVDKMDEVDTSGSDEGKLKSESGEINLYLFRNGRNEDNQDH